MRGLSQIGAGLFTVLYSSGPLWTAALAYVLLRRSIGGVQRAALLLVTAGLGVVALAPSAHGGGGGGGGGGLGGLGGLGLPGGMDREFGVGLLSVLVGTALHALVYVLQVRALRLRALGPSDIRAAGTGPPAHRHVPSALVYISCTSTSASTSRVHLVYISCGRR